MEITKKEFDQQAEDIKEIREMLQMLLIKSAPATKGFIGVAGAAELTHLSPGTIYNLRNLEQIPYHKRKGSNKLLFSVTELNQWMSNKKVTDTPTRKKVMELH
jgi:predicted DNA-binding transcriptional regulator AlpA